MKIHFKCLQLADSEDFFYQDAMQIYIDSFPENERQPLAKIKERIKAGQSLLFVGVLDKQVIAMVLLWDFKSTPFTLLDYMAVAEKYRSQSYGSIFLQILMDKMNQNRKYLIIEVEHPAFGENKIQRRNRILFYLKNGAYLLNNVPYILPALDGVAPTDMQLMIAPKYQDEPLSKSTIVDLITRLYIEVYEKPLNDPLLKRILKQVPANINLINTLS